MLRAPVVVAALAGLVVAAPAGAATARFHPCRDAAPGARCGSVAVPLDRLAAGTDRQRIGIAFELYRRRERSRPSLGTLLDIEGGPGFSSTASRSAYMELDRPLMARRDLLLVDLRGTGLSSPLSCAAFRTTIARYRLRAGSCARELGGVVDLYDTHAAVDDLADVLDALHIARVDLYGDSYGSYAAQAFAVRHGERLRSLVLDGTYPLPGTDPALGDLAEATRRGLRLACARRPACAARDQDPVALVAGLVDEVRRRPIAGVGVDAEGVRRRVGIDERTLTTALQGAYSNFTIYRDLVAAIDSLRRGDRAPLLRIAAEARLDPAAASPRDYSEALYLAVTCHDYPQLWDPAAPFATRRAQLAQARSTLPAEAFAPVSPLAWTALDYEGATACLRWPGPRRPDPPVPPEAPYPDVPTLVLNGDLDNITASSGARVVASRFPRATFVEVQNMTHISALGDRDSCGAPLVRRFVETLSAGDTSCASRIEEVRVVDRFPVRAAEAAPAVPRPGDRSTPAARRAASVAAATVADAIQRWALNYSGRGAGLRGGRWSYDGDDVVHFRFERARFARDVAVSGTATWHRLTGSVVARLLVSGPRGARGRLRVRWNMQRRLAAASFAGRLGGRPLAATAPAP